MGAPCANRARWAPEVTIIIVAGVPGFAIQPRAAIAVGSPISLSRISIGNRALSWRREAWREMRHAGTLYSGLSAHRTIRADVPASRRATAPRPDNRCSPSLRRRRKLFGRAR